MRDLRTEAFMRLYRRAAAAMHTVITFALVDLFRGSQTIPDVLRMDYLM